MKKTDLLLHTSEGRPFSADIHLPEGKAPWPVVVFVHGFKGFKDWGQFNLLAEYFAGQGFAFAKLNLSHNGTTPEAPLDLADLQAFAENNFSKEVSDIRTFIDFLSSSPTELPFGSLDLNRLFLIGHSRGASVAIIAASEDNRVQATASWAGLSSLENRWTPEELEKWKKEGVEYILNTRTGQQMPMNYQIVEDYQANRERFSIEQAAARLGNRLLLVHGDCDESVPVSMANDLKKANPEAKLVLLPGCDHSFGGMHPYTETSLPEFTKNAADHTIGFFGQFAHA